MWRNFTTGDFDCFEFEGDSLLFADSAVRARLLE